MRSLSRLLVHCSRKTQTYTHTHTHTCSRRAEKKRKYSKNKSCFINKKIIYWINCYLLNSLVLTLFRKCSRKLTFGSMTCGFNAWISFSIFLYIKTKLGKNNELVSFIFDLESYIRTQLSHSVLMANLLMSDREPENKVIFIEFYRFVFVFLDVMVETLTVLVYYI